MDIKQSRGEPFQVNSGTFASGSAVVTRAATTSAVHYVTDISAGSDYGTATVVLASSGTNFWQARVGSSLVYDHTFQVPIRITSGSAAVLTVSGGTIGFANLSGYTIHN